MCLNSDCVQGTAVTVPVCSVWLYCTCVQGLAVLSLSSGCDCTAPVCRVRLLLYLCAGCGCAVPLCRVRLFLYLCAGYGCYCTCVQRVAVLYLCAGYGCYCLCRVRLLLHLCAGCGCTVPVCRVWLYCTCVQGVAVPLCCSGLSLSSWPCSAVDGRLDFGGTETQPGRLLAPRIKVNTVLCTVYMYVCIGGKHKGALMDVPVTSRPKRSVHRTIRLLWQPFHRTNRLKVLIVHMSILSTDIYTQIYGRMLLYDISFTSSYGQPPL
jgi:hypothetical protein